MDYVLGSLRANSEPQFVVVISKTLLDNCCFKIVMHHIKPLSSVGAFGGEKPNWSTERYWVF